MAAYHGGGLRMTAGLYAGTILKVDLSTGEVDKEPTGSYTASFLGGRGINIRLFWNYITPGVDALAPGNVLVLGVGPLGGATVSAARTEVTAKSPETGFLGSTNFGGFFGSELKFAGYDHLVICGKAEKPVYLSIDNDQVEVRDASGVWGKDTYEAPELIRDDVADPEAKILCIGPAGENLVRFASVQHELGHGGGRTGMGTVMGSKNLKAIVVRGTKVLSLSDPERFLALSRTLEHLLASDPGSVRKSRYGVTPSYDVQDELFLGTAITLVPEGADPRTNVPKTQAIPQRFAHKRAGCFGCPVQCMEHYVVDESKTGVISCEFYSVFVSFVRCFDPATSLEGAIRCQKYGLDAISTGGLITWLMTLYEKGIITEEDTDGIPMKWGSPQAIIGMVEKIARRQGIGGILAEGIVKAAAEIGRGSEAYAYHVKGLQVQENTHPGWSPHVKGACLGIAVGPRCDNLRSLNVYSALSPFSPALKGIREIAGIGEEYDPESYEGKPEHVVAAEDFNAVADLLGTCKWLTGIFTPSHLADLFSAGSGIQTTLEDILHYAKRMRTMERAYEASEGMTSMLDTLPKSFFNNPIKSGVWKGAVLEPEPFEEMKRRYYALRGWDPHTGIPTEETLKRLGLEDVARKLEARGKLPLGH
jgi:aldehyde:ferredoxin oxidoreductase